MTFDDFFSKAMGKAGVTPYPHQRELAENGLPTAFCSPTGTGKTEAAVLGHQYRRHAHPDATVREATPRWLVLALPTRALVTQTLDRVTGWVENLGLDVTVHAVFGGEGWDDRAWRYAPRSDAIFVGTVDMLLSRALNRGYADGRFNWPISFGLFNNGVQWVFDEVQQMELATVNSRQLQAFRDSMGTCRPTRSMWMSATLDVDLLGTVDAPDVDSSLDATDLVESTDELRARVDAAKRIEPLTISDRKKQSAELAAHAVEHHQPGTLTLLVCNTVGRAREVHRHLCKFDGDAEVVLLHRRFRPPERTNQTRNALADVERGGPGRIVVCTQVLEAGIDLDASTLITELCPWSSLVQRAGRCNRAGKTGGARLLWVDLDDKDAPPYEADELSVTRDLLIELSGQLVTPKTLGAVDAPRPTRIHHVLRRRDLLELFDTSPDLSGDPLDVSQFIRDGEERDVYLAWRDDAASHLDHPGRDELCPVSISEARKWLSGSQRAVWGPNPLETERGWVPVRRGDLRPGGVYIVDTSEGGYEVGAGWTPRSSRRVPGIEQRADHVGFGDDVAVGAEPASSIGRWYALSDHLRDVDDAASDMVDRLAPDLPEPLRTASVRAAALHDLGKAHEVWQEAAKATAGNDVPDPPDVLVAKTPGRGRLRFAQRYFRHELASLVALDGNAAALLDDVDEADLCRYLVAAHHGRVRLSIRSLPGEQGPNGEAVMLGLVQGTELPEVETPTGVAPAGALDLVGTAKSWTSVALGLRDRTDLGPFRLAFLEAIVRLSDWEASRQIEEVH